MAKVILKGYIVVADQDLAAVKQELPRHRELTRSETGCLVFDVVPNLASENRFDVYEEFISPEAFAFHQRRVADSVWGHVTRNVTRHYQMTEEP